MRTASDEGRKLGVLVVGLGGAVSTTAVAGVEMIRAGSNDLVGLPLADVRAPGIAAYRNIQFGGWDLNPDDLATAAVQHRVLDTEQAAAVSGPLSKMRPWAAVGGKGWCNNVDGSNKIGSNGHRAAVDQITRDIRDYRSKNDVDGCVMINLASVERWADLASPALNSIDGFERALDEDDPNVSPAMLYAYAAIREGLPYGNFTPSLAADVPALTQLATKRNVPVAGKDGKTGQTMIKTVLAPALRSRSLYVEGWFSTNILGNRDGLALDDPASLKSKLNTKASVLDSILGYPVEDHLVHIHYYKPRGDNKEAWDNIDIVGFLGQKMQIKVNFLCRDSILAAPLVIEIARVLDLAKQRGDGGVQEQLGLFFKAPQTSNGHDPEHAFPAQERRLMEWLAA
ncbi:MAG TPA: inositol-3-phosphate synthase [Stellaceae bacterium]|jgi:myo-inositol-1-phosphate synthase